MRHRITIRPGLASASLGALQPHGLVGARESALLKWCEPLSAVSRRLPRRFPEQPAA